jgi:hypothetical protein
MLFLPGRGGGTAVKNNRTGEKKKKKNPVYPDARIYVKQWRSWYSARRAMNLVRCDDDISSREKKKSKRLQQLAELACVAANGYKQQSQRG